MGLCEEPDSDFSNHLFKDFMEIWTALTIRKIFFVKDNIFKLNFILWGWHRNTFYKKILWHVTINNKKN